MSKLLWKPYAQKAGDEPTAKLEFNGQVYLLPYTLMAYLEGWLETGCAQSGAVVDAQQQVIAAVGNIVKEMRSICSSVSQEDKEFYEKHGLRVTEEALTPITDYADIEPVPKEDAEFVLALNFRN